MQTDQRTVLVVPVVGAYFFMHFFGHSRGPPHRTRRPITVPTAYRYYSGVGAYCTAVQRGCTVTLIIVKLSL